MHNPITLRLVLILCTTMLVSFAALSQQLSITGRVTDKKGNPVSYASVVVTSFADSQRVIRKAADSNGVFTCSPELAGPYIVLVTAVGMLPLEKKITINSSNRRFVFVMEQSGMEGNVTVVAKKPLMRQEDDKTIIDPENLAASSTNAYEVMEKVPGVFVDQDGNIYLSSTTPATVYINGREMRMSAADMATILKSLPPGSIQKIEVLRTPSAKYDASGSGGIVNVVLKKGVKIGKTGSVYANLNQGVYGNQSIGFTLNNTAGKRNSYLNLQYAHRDSYEQIQTNRKFSPDSLLAQDAYTRYPNHGLFAGYGMGWELNKKWELNYDGRISLNSSKNTTDNQSLISKLSTATLITNNGAAIENKGRTLFLNQGLGTKYKIDTAGSEWTTDIAYNFNSSNTDQVFLNSFLVPVVAATGGDGSIESRRHFLTAQTDVKWKLAKQLTFEAGLKTALMQFNSGTAFFRTTGGVRTKDGVRTNTFRYRENINAAYLQASKTVSGIVFKAGVRSENTNMNGRQLIPADTSFTIRRTDLFPYLYINRELFRIAGYPLTAYLIYRRTISRPAYDYLNPFPRFVDQYLTEAGNPSLRPQFTNNAEFNISVDETPLLAFGHNYTKDIFTNVIYQADSGRSTAIRTYDNLGTNREFYFRALGAIPPGKRYFFVVGAQYNHNYYNGLYESKPLSFKRGSWSVFTYQTFRIDKRSVLSLNGFIRLKGQLQFYELSNFGALNLSVNRQFLNKKLVVTLSGNDLFFTNRNDFSILQGTVNAAGFRRSDTRRIGISLRYNFGIRKKEDNNLFNTESPDKTN